MANKQLESVWSELKQKLPWQKTPEEKAKRDIIWQSIDVNGNGILSLAELDKGLCDVLNIQFLFAVKSVLIRAFNAAKVVIKPRHSYGDDYVSRGEFRILLKYLRQFYEYWVAFDRVDADDDRRISFNEFIMAKHQI